MTTRTDPLRGNSASSFNLEWLAWTLLSEDVPADESNIRVALLASDKSEHSAWNGQAQPDTWQRVGAKTIPRMRGGGVVRWTSFPTLPLAS